MSFRRSPAEPAVGDLKGTLKTMKFLAFCIASSGALLALGCQASTSDSVEIATPTAEPAPKAAMQDPGDVRIEGDHLVIDRHINFAFDSHEILADSFDLLDHIAGLLKNHPEVKKIHVIGHTDATGTVEHNQELSEKRANSVKEALVARGIPQSIDSTGKGETSPLCTEKSEECDEKNRRVEFLIEQQN